MSLTTHKLVYFVRHGESEANLKNIFQAPDDVVTEHGRKQNTLVGARFATIPFEALIASPFLRARATADAISQASGKEVEEEHLFREFVPPSSLLNSHRDEDAGRTFMQLRKEHIKDPSWHYEDEENYFDLHERAGVALGYLLERKERTLVVVTHLGFLKAIVTYMLTKGAPEPETYINIRFLMESVNTGVSIARFGRDKRGREGWRLVTWNDFTHLPLELAERRDEVGVM